VKRASLVSPVCVSLCPGFFTVMDLFACIYTFATADVTKCSYFFSLKSRGTLVIIKDCDLQKSK